MKQKRGLKNSETITISGNKNVTANYPQNLQFIKYSNYELWSKCSLMVMFYLSKNIRTAVNWNCFTLSISFIILRNCLENKYCTSKFAKPQHSQMERLEFMNEVLIYAPRTLVGWYSELSCYVPNRWICNESIQVFQCCNHHSTLFTSTTVV